MSTEIRKSWVMQNIATVADMVSYCPSFWEICGVDPADPVVAQIAARLRVKQSNSMTFGAEADAVDPTLADDLKLKPRKRLDRTDWIDARPLATVMHVIDAFSIAPRATGQFVQSGSVSIVVEKNAIDEDNRIYGDGDMPSEEAADIWIDQVCRMVEDFNEIAVCNRQPATQAVYPLRRLSVLNTTLAVPPQFSTLEMNRAYGPHFIATILVQFGAKS